MTHIYNNYGLYKGKPSGFFVLFNDSVMACLHGGVGPQIGEVTWGRSPHPPCKRDHIKMRDYMDRRVTPPKQVTLPTWGPPPPCKQVLRRELVLLSGPLDKWAFKTLLAQQDHVLVLDNQAGVKLINWYLITSLMLNLSYVGSKTVNKIDESLSIWMSWHDYTVLNFVLAGVFLPGSIVIGEFPL